MKNCNIKFVVLYTDKETLLKRDKLRPDDCQMGERCLILLNKIMNAKFDSQFLLDTTSLTIEDAIKTICTNNRFTIK